MATATSYLYVIVELIRLRYVSGPRQRMLMLPCTYYLLLRNPATNVFILHLFDDLNGVVGDRMQGSHLMQVSAHVHR